ncbi:MAG: ATP-binding cassette domain-containing protein [Chthoniobacteraceae bacterium]
MRSSSAPTAWSRSAMARTPANSPRKTSTTTAWSRSWSASELKNLRIEGKGVQEADYFAVEGLRTGFKPKQTVSFSVGRGEILGFAGLVGAGRSEVAQAIFGVEPPLEGTIRIGGERVHIHSARTAISHGIYLVPEDRRLTGLITSVCIRENISLPALTRHSKAMLVNRQAEKRIAQEQVEALRVKTPSIETIAANLSGGNQQKVVLGKWLSLKPKVMIFDEPTRGIDVGAKAEIYKLMRALADEGVAVIMISSDMEEVIGVSDRIAVMHEGRISGILSHSEFSEKAIMQLAVGGSVAAN